MNRLLGPKDSRRESSPDSLVRTMFREYPDMLRSLEVRIVSDELAWRRSGYPMYFPDSPGLLEMLWRARVEVRMEDLELSKSPRAFAISWPKCEIDGVQPRGCLVWWGDGKDQVVSADRFEEHYFHKGFFAKRETDGEDEQLGVHLSFQKEDSESMQYGVPFSYYRVSVPSNLFRQGLASDKDFEENFKQYRNSQLRGVLPLSPDEIHIQYVTFKLAMRLLVYMRACPEYVHEGYPEGKNHKAFDSRWMKIGPRVIGVPGRAMGIGTHESPMVHLRTWHFRSYPIKKDGTRKDGVVFVRMTVVNADVDPTTVENGGRVNGNDA